MKSFLIHIKQDKMSEKIYLMLDDEILDEAKRFKKQLDQAIKDFEYWED